ncbi:MAG: LysM peptidoglycan-binding domain-containing protein [Betaproteobacteria bacterium]|nr:LysM peptidoglycan-binding domain-containing protein [Betaproteobacteria bacterium]
MKIIQISIVLVLLLTGLVPASSLAQTDPANAADPKATPPLQLAEGAPASYTVVKGDTLWGISGKFLKDPWRWPEIWNMNREQVQNPNLIYPGNVIVLSFDANGRPRLSLQDAGGAPSTTNAGASDAASAGDTVKLSPQVRYQRLDTAIPSIPESIIAPFLSLPLVVENDALLNAPRIVAAEEERVIIGAGNTAYAAGIKPSQPLRWQIYRPDKKLVDPVTQEVLGYEAIFLGDARVTRFGESTTLNILKSTQEIRKGDRLTPTAEIPIPTYVPHAPDKLLKGAVVSILGGVNESARYSIVVLNLGKRNGAEVGHVLASLQRGQVVSTKDGLGSAEGFSWSSLVPSFLSRKDNSQIPSTVKLPDERNALLFVFRVFDKVSYALVMNSSRPIRVNDVVQSP